MQNREQAIGYIIYALLKWGVSVVEVKKVMEKLLNTIPQDAEIDNFRNTELLEEFANDVIYHYAPHHFDEDGEKMNISRMIYWAYDDYTIEEAGDMFEKFNELLKSSMRFNLYY